MNFVDIQPNFSLDYAWTSPSRSPAVMNTTKPSKASRKQNRCCDQCRKGKRACDAAILEDTLLDDGKIGERPSTFHYSGEWVKANSNAVAHTLDVFGPLAACGNCEKTKKNCTFEWLKSQRIAQSVQPQTSPLPPPKRRRTSSEKSSSRRQHVEDEAIPQDRSDSSVGGNLDFGLDDMELGVTFADFAGGPTGFDLDPSNFVLQDISNFSQEFGIAHIEGQAASATRDDNVNQFDGAHGSLLDTGSETFEDDRTRHTPMSAPRTDMHSTTSRHNTITIRHSRKKSRRGSSNSFSNGAQPCPASSLAINRMASTSNTMLTENLLRIYQNSFENALSCWVTERTCPTIATADISLIDNGGPNWNRIYHRVFRLDRVMANVRKRQLTLNENALASKALNLAIYAFATQWAQPITNKKTRYPFNSAVLRNKGGRREEEEEVAYPTPSFDRTAQMRTWNEAYITLQDAAGLESFRVALAHIIFSLTYKPAQNNPRSEVGDQARQTKQHTNNAGQSIGDCEDLLSKLNITIEADGPPMHLEQGLRSIHSLKSQVLLHRHKEHIGKQSTSLSDCRSTLSLDSTDRATLDLLFRVSIMFDTLSAAINKRPLIVSDEDSNMYSDEVYNIGIFPESTVPREVNRDLIGDREEYKGPRLQSCVQIVRWPWSFDQATKTLCEAAPVKVNLFRKITRIQTLLVRGSQGTKIEACIKIALKICSYWERHFAPFIQDCIHNHPQLHPRIQSWCICLAGHWHLATLLLADVIDMIDEEQLGLDVERKLRASSNLLSAVRKASSGIIANIARCTCPRDDSLLPRFHDFRVTLNQESLLGEPWTAILVRAFAKAGVILLRQSTIMGSIPCTNYEDTLDQAEDCVRALVHLGRKSDTALSAGKILGEAVSILRKGIQENGNHVNDLLDHSDIWHEFGDLAGEFGPNCDT